MFKSEPDDRTGIWLADVLGGNFGNTGTGNFVPLPYVNLVVRLNTPPNLNQLTGDRLKLMTWVKW